MTFDTVSLHNENKELAERVDRAEISTQEVTHMQAAERKIYLYICTYIFTYTLKLILS